MKELKGIKSSDGLWTTSGNVMLSTRFLQVFNYEEISLDCQLCIRWWVKCVYNVQLCFDNEKQEYECYWYSLFNSDQKSQNELLKIPLSNHTSHDEPAQLTEEKKRRFSEV